MTISRRRDMLLGLAAVAATLTVGSFAHAKRKVPTRVVWTSVELPEDKLQKVRENTLRNVLRKEAKDADWGEQEGARLEASVKVVEFLVLEREDVVRVTCTAVGKLAKGPSVRTHFSLGDHPKQQAKLEKMILTLVARGLVTRLSSIARKQGQKKEATTAA